jgi:hypothetical protein
MTKRKWVPVKQADSDWPLGTEGRVFWKDENEPNVLAIYYLYSGSIGAVECAPGGYKDLNDRLKIEDMPGHPEYQPTGW